MATPIFYIYADGKDVTENFRGAGISMSITDGVGLKSDTLEIVVDDNEGVVEAPRTGAILRPVGGYEGRLRDFGLFSVDRVSYSGWPQKISITASSFAAKSLAREREIKAFPKKEFPTVGSIFTHIAGKVNLTLKMSASLMKIENEYEAQTEENSFEFATRLGQLLGASVTAKGMHLVVVREGEGLSASGNNLDRLRVAKDHNLLSYNVVTRDTRKHKAVEGTYYDRKKNKRSTVSIETGLEGPTFLLQATFNSKQDAQRAASARAKKIIRDDSEATFELIGEPDAMAEQFADVSGCRINVDGVWRIKTATHNFSSTNGYRTSLSCEVPSSGKPTGSNAKKPSPATSSRGGQPPNGSGLESGAPSLTGDGSTNIG